MNLQRTTVENSSRERGATLVEYSLLIALIVIVCVVSVAALGDTTNAPLDDANSLLAAGS